MQSPRTSHMLAAKRIMRYIKGTLSHGVAFSKGKSFLLGFSDADWAGNVDDRRSTGGYCIFLGNNPMSWSSKKQTTIARSSTEAEYRTLAHSGAEMVWLCSLLKDLHFCIPAAPKLGCDNISTLYLASNPVQHSKMKHIHIDYHFIRELVQAKALDIFYVSTLEQLADIFTKPLHGPRFLQLRDKLKVLASTTIRLRGNVDDNAVQYNTG